MNSVSEIWNTISPEALREGLASIRDDLRSGSILPAEGETEEVSHKEWLEVFGKPQSKFLAMETAVVWGEKCGSIACIGGHLLLRAGVDCEAVTMAVTHPPGDLSELFMPGALALFGHWRKLTPEQAAGAIDEWLGGNVENPWKGAEALLLHPTAGSEPLPPPMGSEQHND